MAFYHIGLNLTAAMLVVRGVTQVLEADLSGGLDEATKPGWIHLRKH